MNKIIKTGTTVNYVNGAGVETTDVIKTAGFDIVNGVIRYNLANEENIIENVITNITDLKDEDFLNEDSTFNLYAEWYISNSDVTKEMFTRARKITTSPLVLAILNATGVSEEDFFNTNAEADNMDVAQYLITWGVGTDIFTTVADIGYSDSGYLNHSTYGEELLNSAEFVGNEFDILFFMDYTIDLCNRCSAFLSNLKPDSVSEENREEVIKYKKDFDNHLTMVANTKPVYTYLKREVETRVFNRDVREELENENS